MPADAGTDYADFGATANPDRINVTTPVDALVRAIHDPRPTKGAGLVAHSDRGAQDLAIKHTERLAEIGIEPSVGSVGDLYDNALAETVIGLFKTEFIRRRGPWRSHEAVEFATVGWVHWFDHRRRLLKAIGTPRPPRPKRHTTP